MDYGTDADAAATVSAKAVAAEQMEGTVDCSSAGDAAATMSVKAAAAEQMEGNVDYTCDGDGAVTVTVTVTAIAAEGECCGAPLTGSKQCPKGHALSYAPASAGVCDRCLGWVPEGQLVSVCQDCNWYLCTRCTPITECPQGHSLCAAAAPEGKCDGCGRKVEQ